MENTIEHLKNAFEVVCKRKMEFCSAMLEAKNAPDFETAKNILLNALTTQP